MEDRLKLIMEKEDLKKLEKSDVIMMEIREPFRVSKDNNKFFAYDGTSEFLEIFNGDMIGGWNINDAKPYLAGDGSFAVSHPRCKYHCYEKHQPEYENKKQILVEAGLWEKE